MHDCTLFTEKIMSEHENILSLALIKYSLLECSVIMLYKFICFGLVGFVGLLIDFSVTYLLKEKCKANRFFANSVGFSLAASSNYILNRIWTFQSSNPEIMTEYGMFILVSLIGLAINNLCLWLFENKLPFYVAKLGAIIVTVVWNFFANYFFTFAT